MSIAMMSTVWTIKLPDSEKLVLLALADAANDEGVCWPSMASLVAKCSKSDRTIQAAIKSLVEAGHLKREERVGRGVVYTVCPRSGFAPEGNDANPRSGFGQTIKNHHISEDFVFFDEARAEGVASPDARSAVDRPGRLAGMGDRQDGSLAARPRRPRGGSLRRLLARRSQPPRSQNLRLVRRVAPVVSKLRKVQ